MMIKSIIAGMAVCLLAVPAFAAESAAAGNPGVGNFDHHRHGHGGWHGRGAGIGRDRGLGACNYDDAINNGGWGWDPVSGTSCAPRCNYDNAINNGGWGWDPVAGTSCPPLCNYDDAANNGGWGWDPVAGMSCPPE